MASDTRQQRNKFFKWLDNSSDQEIGSLLKEYIQEADHGCWEGFNRYAQGRVLMELFADMNRYREAWDRKHVIPSDQQPGSVEAAVRYLIDSFDLDPHDLDSATEAIVKAVEQIK